MAGVLAAGSPAGLPAGSDNLSSVQHLRWPPYIVYALEGPHWEGLRGSSAK